MISVAGYARSRHSVTPPSASVWDAHHLYKWAEITNRRLANLVVIRNLLQIVALAPLLPRVADRYTLLRTYIATDIMFQKKTTEYRLVQTLLFFIAALKIRAKSAMCSRFNILA